MKKTIGILSLFVFLASFGWKLTQAYLTVKPSSNLVDIGYLRGTEGSILQIKHGSLTVYSGLSAFTIDSPINGKIDNIVLVASSLTCLLTAIALLKKDKDEA